MNAQEFINHRGEEELKLQVEVEERNFFTFNFYFLLSQNLN